MALAKKLFSSVLTVTVACIGSLSSQVAQADEVLIINGASKTSELDTTSAITNNLNQLLQNAGFTTTISDATPENLNGFDQIWDIRFSNNLAITASEQTEFLSFLQGGGGMFVMGENDGFTTRNNSVLNLIQAAGGGLLTFVTPDSTQNVLSPFTELNPIPNGNVVYANPGGVSSPGTGKFITVDNFGRGTGVAFGKGDLANALNGALTTIFDVNFMQALYDLPNSQNLLKNLIGFLEEETSPTQPSETVPEPTSTIGLLVASALVAGSTLKRKKSS